MFGLICAGANGWTEHRDGGDMRRHRAHDDVVVMMLLERTYRYADECKSQVVH